MSAKLVHTLPRRACFVRGKGGLLPGIYLSHLPAFEHVDLRLEGASTDTDSSSVEAGQFLYYETIQRQGPTNKGFLVGDWVGRQGNGRQAWLTYHLSLLEAGLSDVSKCESI